MDTQSVVQPSMGCYVAIEGGAPTQATTRMDLGNILGEKATRCRIPRT